MRRETKQERTSRVSREVRGSALSPAVAAMAVAAMAVAATPLQAAWEENGRAILTLDELLPRVESVAGAVRSEVTGPTAILCDEDVLAGSEKAIAVALIQSELVLDAARGTVRLAHPTTERDRAARRQFAAIPLAVAASDPLAIEPGCVALFGEVIEGPYRIERVGDTIELNGVTVYPARGERGSQPTVSPAQQIEHDVMSAAMDRYQAARGTSAETSARARLLEDLRAIPDLRSAEWIDADNARLVFADGREEWLGFEVGRTSEPDEAAAQSETLDRLVVSLQELLASDGTLLCGATYLVPVWEPRASILEPRIAAITHSDEPEPLRIARLQAYTLDRAAAADLVFAR